MLARRSSLHGDWLLAWALLLAAAILLVACKRTGGVGAGPGESPKKGQDQGEKINVYVACINNLNPAVHKSREQYLSWVDPAKGPVSPAPPKGKRGKTTPLPTPPRLAGVADVSRDTTYGSECFKKGGGLDEVVTKAPRHEALDSAGLAYKQAVDELLAVNKTAFAYYEQGDYKGDNLKKGKELHKPLMDAFAKFDKATSALRGAMDQVQDQATQEELADLERGEGKKASWHQITVMRKAKAVLHAVKASGPDAARLAGEPIRGLGAHSPQETLDALGDDYAKSWEEMKAWTDANRAEADKLATWGTFVTHAETLITQLKEMKRARAASKGKLPAKGNGSIHTFVESYNTLAECSNRLHDD